MNSRAPGLDPFYLIVDDVEWIRRLAPVGLKLVQLRIKNTETDRLRRQVREALKLCRKHGVQLILNDHWQLAIELGCDFVHLGQEDLDGADLEAIRGAGLKLGISTHDAGELYRVLGLAPDYVALGPIFATRSKTLRFAPQGLEPLGVWKQQLRENFGDIPLVAIGGLTPEHARAVLDAGADSLAVISDVSSDPDPETRVRYWLEITRPGPNPRRMETP